MIDDKLLSLHQSLWRGWCKSRGKVSSPSHPSFCYISLSGPAGGRETERSQTSQGSLRSIGRALSWHGCILQGLKNVKGWEADRIRTPFLLPQWHLSAEMWEGSRVTIDPRSRCPGGERVGGCGEACVCHEDIPHC